VCSAIGAHDPRVGFNQFLADGEPRDRVLHPVEVGGWVNASSGIARSWSAG
jgi:hypothetical protein